MVSAKLLLWLSTALSASAGVVSERQSVCSTYTIIDTRGTGEAQGESSGFRTMNANIRSQVSGGQTYNTVYAADASQNSAAGTADIVREINAVLAQRPNECFILEGYSQGAAATVNAMSKITGAAFTAVRGVFLIGDPEHRSGLACNVDQNGGTTTKNVNGLSAALGGIPSNWISKTLDVCNYGDGVCDTTHGYGINAQHLAYPTSTSVQNLGTKFVVGKLRGTS
ncbi:hypothetical protein LTR56_018953 [Elasticomyces elasticus]|nr:hypothetical protein LTR56_018953 [Elasticomyces elasticus]KAK3635579.1 hypothetical protein LTR22_019147 [Elasticomyces elasticus]KAK4911718.1 hypothetical protein LTR49_019708 [Elasticomyces elasticus]KAK5683141.1 hypothetical protein LTS10_004672 [Elasticomyces elasticus]KAK5769756.1 hypothetical protein LTS12_000206 [Elasticomyces elasticus]